MDCTELAEWREREGYTQSHAAQLLGIALNTYQNYERGFRYMGGGSNRDVPIPKTVELSCAAISMGIFAYHGEEFYPNDDE